MKDFVMYFFAFSLTLTTSLILWNLYRTFFKDIKGLKEIEISKVQVERVKKKKVKKDMSRKKNYKNNTYQSYGCSYLPYEEKKAAGYDGPYLSSNSRTYEEYSRRNRISR